MNLIQMMILIILYKNFSNTPSNISSELTVQSEQQSLNDKCTVLSEKIPETQQP